MVYIGTDLHKDSVSVVVCTEDGQVLEKERLACKCVGKIREFFSRPEVHPCLVIVEAVGFYHWFFDLLEPVADRLVLCNPVEVKKYSWDEAKTDFRDARKLALLAAGGEFSRNRHLTCFVPDAVLRSFREITRHRQRLVSHHISFVNSARRIFLKCNLAGPAHLSAPALELFLSRFGERFSDQHRRCLYHICDNLLTLERQIRDTEATIREVLSEDRFQKTREILTSIPGVGDLTAATLIAEIGDYRRFAYPEQLSAYAGIVSRVFRSAETTRYGHITKTGSPYIRRALVQAAWVAVRAPGRPRTVFQRIARRAGTKKAIIALARRMLVWSWFLVNRQQLWHDTCDTGSLTNAAGMTLTVVLSRARDRVNSVA